MPRFKDYQWNMPEQAGAGYSWETIQTSLLHDLRDEFKRLNSQMETIRHFFHQPGMASAIKAVIVRENKRERQRKASLRRRRLARKAAR